jgi:hypothetical protein
MQTRIEEKNLEALRLTLQADFIAAVEEYKKQKCQFAILLNTGIVVC